MPLPAFPPEWGVAEAKKLADGIGGEVWRVTLAAGMVAVAKRISAQALPEAGHGAAFLHWRNGVGSVRLLADEGGWQLQEHAGTHRLLDVLNESGDAPATRIACDVLMELHAPALSPVPAALQPLPARFASLFARADRSESAQQGGLVGEAAALARQLLADQRDLRPLHGDMHHENILFGPRGWLAIDPHGLFGDPAYDAANLFYNPVGRQDLRTDPFRISTMAEMLSTRLQRDRETILGYGFAHACLSACWHLEDGSGEEASRSLEVAVALRRALATLA